MPASSHIDSTRDVVWLVAYKLTGDDAATGEIVGRTRTAITNWRRTRGIATVKPTRPLLRKAR
jgi:hypothetical protein